MIEEENLSRIYHVQNADDLVKYADDLVKYVRDPKHRVQTWHHASVFGVRFCLYVVAVQGKILRVALIDVTESKRLNYVKYMSMLWDTYMWPFERVETNPNEMRSSDLGFLATFENLQFVIAYRAR
jgi:hypothetical protein